VGLVLQPRLTVMQPRITVGAPLSLTGRFAVQGQQAHRGLVLWAEHTNRTGGLAVSGPDGKLLVDLSVYDDASTRAGAATATERLIRDNRVDLLLSPYSSVLTIAAAEVAERHGLVLWNHGGSSDALDERGWRHVVTLLTPASRYFEPVLDLAIAAAECDQQIVRTVALLHGGRGTFPQAVADGGSRHADRLGLEIVLREPYPSEEELPALVRRLIELQPDVVLAVGATEADLAFVREACRQRLIARMFAVVAAPIEQFQAALGSDADGFCGPSQWEPTLQDAPDIGPTSAEFAGQFRARFGTEPDYPAAQAYAAGLIAAECVGRAGSLVQNALRQAAAALDLTTFYGRFRLDPTTGWQVGHEMVVVQWQDCQKQIVWPTAAATARFQLPVLTAAPIATPSEDTS
jgi:branched-chain amino acid transport system substrate-binding protein